MTYAPLSDIPCLSCGRQRWPYLTVSLEEASSRIHEQENKAVRFLSESRKVTVEVLLASRQAWEDYSLTLLKRLFTTDELAKEFREISVEAISLAKTPADRVQAVEYCGWRQWEKLGSIRERLWLYIGPTSSRASGDLSPKTRNVFLVHGRDPGLKHGVARFLSHLKLNPVILDEQTGGSETVIERFERTSIDVCFAVVLLTPDDEGRLRNSENLMPRARQNVVFELGYFFGKLGRGKVCALMEGKLEQPSDIHGFLYVPLDPDGAWKFKLASQMKSAELDVDMNLIV